MKKLFILFICIIYAIVFVYGLNGANKLSKAVGLNNALDPYTVIIDPGHGGKDCGTVGVDGSLEKDVNLSIALILKDYLCICGFNTKMTREGDYELYPEGSNKNRSDLYNRLDFANSFKNATLISIHQNHFSDESQHGAQVWYSANTEKSKAIADSILNRIKNNLQPDNKRNNKKSDDSYYILYKAKNPSVMVECGFMSNNNECKNLNEYHYQKKIAYSILTGIYGEQ